MAFTATLQSAVDDYTQACALSVQARVRTGSDGGEVAKTVRRSADAVVAALVVDVNPASRSLRELLDLVSEDQSPEMSTTVQQVIVNAMALAGTRSALPRAEWSSYVLREVRETMHNALDQGVERVMSSDVTWKSKLGPALGLALRNGRSGEETLLQ